VNSNRQGQKAKAIWGCSWSLNGGEYVEAAIDGLVGVLRGKISPAKKTRMPQPVTQTGLLSSDRMGTSGEGNVRRPRHSIQFVEAYPRTGVRDQIRIERPDWAALFIGSMEQSARTSAIQMARSLDWILLTPAAVMSAQALANDPFTSIARQASSTT
jgi:hypothetical protein